MRRPTFWTGLAMTCAMGLGLATLSTVLADDAKVSGDLKKMQGTWVRAGEEGPELKWVVEGEGLKASVNGQDYTSKLPIDSSATPHPTADITIKAGPGDSAGKASKAIYKWEGERLVFCLTHPGGETRPTEFKAVEEQQFLFVLKKQ